MSSWHIMMVELHHLSWSWVVFSEEFRHQHQRYLSIVLPFDVRLYERLYQKMGQCIPANSILGKVLQSCSRFEIQRFSSWISMQTAGDQPEAWSFSVQGAATKLKSGDGWVKVYKLMLYHPVVNKKRPKNEANDIICKGWTSVTCFNKKPTTPPPTTTPPQLLYQGVRFLYLMPSVVEIWMFGDVSWTCCNAMLRKARGETGDEG